MEGGSGSGGKRKKVTTAASLLLLVLLVVTSMLKHHDAAVTSSSTSSLLVYYYYNNSTKKKKVATPPSSFPATTTSTSTSNSSSKFETTTTTILPVEEEEEQSATTVTAENGHNSAEQQPSGLTTTNSSSNIKPAQQARGGKRDEETTTTVGAGTTVSMTNETTTKPMLILHIGPHKTGTTYLQRVLAGCTTGGGFNETETRKLLESDGFVYLGTAPVAVDVGGGGCDYQRYIRHWTPGKPVMWMDYQLGEAGEFWLEYPHIPDIKGTPQLTENVMNKLNALKRSGRSGMIVNEYLSYTTPKQLEYLAKLLKPHFRVRIVIVYRPLFDWMVSLANQKAKHNKHDTGALWPGQPGSSINLPFDLELSESNFTKRFRAMLRYRKHPVEVLRERFAAAHFDDIRILPFHRMPKAWGKGNEMLGYFLCSIVGEGLFPHTCAEIFNNGRLGSLTSAKDKREINGYSNLNYRFLADAAFRKGWIKPQHSRYSVMRLIQSRQEKQRHLNVSAFPTHCMSNETLQPLWQLSRDMQERLFMEDYAKNASLAASDAAKLEGSWQSLLAKRRHCYIDTNATLADPFWKNWFLQKFQGR